MLTLFFLERENRFTIQIPFVVQRRENSRVEYICRSFGNTYEALKLALESTKKIKKTYQRVEI